MISLCIARQFCLRRQSVRPLVLDGLAAICDHFHDFVPENPIANEEGLEELAVGFNEKSYGYHDKNFRVMQSCVGALDGIVFQILPPDAINQGRYWSRKGYSALSFQAMCDSN